jgi:MarR family 2-MHQ and catechol resistance regulon transcriptional repressor
VPVSDRQPPATPHAAADARTQQALRTYVKLLRAAKAWLARVEPRLAANGFTATQLGVLEAILHRGPLTQRDLGRKVLTSAGNLTDVIDKLEARGLVARTRSRADRRVVHVDLTPAGRALITALFPAHAADIAGGTEGLSVAELVLLGDLLRRLGRHAQEVPLEDKADAA